MAGRVLGDDGEKSVNRNGSFSCSTSATLSAMKCQLMLFFINWHDRAMTERIAIERRDRFMSVHNNEKLVLDRLQESLQLLGRTNMTL